MKLAVLFLVTLGEFLLHKIGLRLLNLAWWKIKTRLKMVQVYLEGKDLYRCSSSLLTYLLFLCVLVQVNTNIQCKTPTSN